MSQGRNCCRVSGDGIRLLSTHLGPALCSLWGVVEKSRRIPVRAGRRGGTPPAEGGGRRPHASVSASAAPTVPVLSGRSPLPSFHVYFNVAYISHYINNERGNFIFLWAVKKLYSPVIRQNGPSTGVKS